MIVPNILSIRSVRPRNSNTGKWNCPCDPCPTNNHGDAGYSDAYYDKHLNEKHSNLLHCAAPFTDAHLKFREFLLHQNRFICAKCPIKIIKKLGLSRVFEGEHVCIECYALSMGDLTKISENVASDVEKKALITEMLEWCQLDIRKHTEIDSDDIALLDACYEKITGNLAYAKCKKSIFDAIRLMVSERFIFMKSPHRGGAAKNNKAQQRKVYLQQMKSLLDGKPFELYDRAYGLYGSKQARKRTEMTRQREQLLYSLLTSALSDAARAQKIKNLGRRSEAMWLRTLGLRTVLARKNHLGKIPEGIDDRTVGKAVMHINFRERKRAKQELLKTRQIRPSDTPGGWVALEIQRLTPRATDSEVRTPTLTQVRSERRAAVRADANSGILDSYYTELENTEDTSTIKCGSESESDQEEKWSVLPAPAPTGGKLKHDMGHLGGWDLANPAEQTTRMGENPKPLCHRP